MLWITMILTLGEPLVLIDTTGCDMYEMASQDEISKANEGEVGLVVIHVEDLVQSGLKPEEIAVITPYNLQVELIRLQLSSKYPGLEIRSVDGFQGREKEAVVLSLVRSNPNGEVGFLAEHRRLNVAVTRARRHACVICDAETVGKGGKFLKEFVDYMTEAADVRTALQYQHILDSTEVSRPEGLELTVKDEIKDRGSKGSSESKGSDKSRVKEPNKRGQKKEQGEGEKNQGGDGNKKKGHFHTEKKPTITEEEQTEKDNQKKVELTKVIEDFIASDKKVHAFSSNLNSHDRLVVHEIAESFDLIHESKGEGKQRQVLVKKKNVKDNGVNEKKLFVGGDLEETPKVSEEDRLRNVPKANLELNELHKLRLERAKASNTNTTLEKEIAKAENESKNKKKGKKATGTKSKVKSQQVKDEEDIDKLLASFNKLDTVCNYEKCKAKAGTLGVNCDFCRIRFCLSHAMPEIHGCGDAAKRAARQMISRDGQLYSGSGRPSKKPDAAKKAQLKFRLDKKLSGMEEERRTKKKEK